MNRINFKHDTRVCLFYSLQCHYNPLLEELLPRSRKHITQILPFGIQVSYSRAAMLKLNLII